MYNTNFSDAGSMSSDTSEALTYQDVSVLSKFINEQGKILPRRVTGLSSKEHKRVTKLVKQARMAVLLPFVIGKN